MEWPCNKEFAFTIFDDTDNANLDNVKIVYDFLTDLGMLTTKSVWASHHFNRLDHCATLEEDAYTKWLKEIAGRGFEIALHNASYYDSLRENTVTGFERFFTNFGYYPVSLANHDVNKESIYWGSKRVTGINRLLYNILTQFRHHHAYFGENEHSPFFWGDLCRQHIKYVRNFVFTGINTLKRCPMMPYHDPLKSYVNYWFASSEGSNVDSFTTTISESAQGQLIAERGACIMYTHFASGFVVDGKLNSKFKTLLTKLSKMNGWFVPVNILLDYLLTRQSGEHLSTRNRFYLELKWLYSKLLSSERASTRKFFYPHG
jgi:hypothetical protein